MGLTELLHALQFFRAPITDSTACSGGLNACHRTSAQSGSPSYHIWRSVSENAPRL